MRNADLATILRIALVLFLLYLVIIKFNAVFCIFLLAVVFVLDGVDGYLALREISKGKVSIRMYLDYALGSRREAKKISELKHSIEKTTRYGPRFDVAGDRIVEYSFWVVFTFLNIVPLFILLIVIIRHSIADAFLGMKGTSAKAKSRIAKLLYTSNASRAFANILKFVTFSYFILVFVSGYPLIPAYILMALLVIWLVARGSAEVYESFQE
jgi:phosphatidylglycerophosphate synthase